MNIEHINPDTLFDSKPYSFSQVVITSGARTIHCSGQTSNDKDLNIIGINDLAKQAECAFENLGHALAACGAGPQHVANIRLYVVAYSVEKLETLGMAISKFFGSVPPSACTIIGVQSLALPEFLIEIEATAVTD